MLYGFINNHTKKIVGCFTSKPKYIRVAEAETSNLAKQEYKQVFDEYEKLGDVKTFELSKYCKIPYYERHFGYKDYVLNIAKKYNLQITDRSINSLVKYNFFGKGKDIKSFLKQLQEQLSVVASSIFFSLEQLSDRSQYNLIMILNNSPEAIVYDVFTKTYRNVKLR